MSPGVKSGSQLVTQTLETKKQAVLDNCLKILKQGNVHVNRLSAVTQPFIAIKDKICTFCLFTHTHDRTNSNRRHYTNKCLCYFETIRRWHTAAFNPAVCRIPRLQIQLSDAPDRILQLMHVVRAYCRINAACLDAVPAIVKANNAIQFVLCLLHVTFQLGKSFNSFVISFFGISHIEIKR